MTLLAFITVAPFIDAPMVTNLLNGLIIVVAVTAVGRSALALVVALCLATPAVVLRWLSMESHASRYFELMLSLNALVYAIAIGYLLRYVFDRKVVTADRLWGAAATYLMMGVLWSFLYAVIDQESTDAFAVRGAVGSLQLEDLLYFSFSTLTTTGFGDIIPLSRAARAAATCEVLMGQLFLAIMTARLVSIYTPLREEVERSSQS
jgi:hypothetical protein